MVSLSRVAVNHISVSLKSPVARKVRVHFIAKGEKSACSSVQCADHLQCRVVNSEPICDCIQNCFDVKPICASNFKTYQSSCHLYRDQCLRYGKNMTSFNITIRHEGACQGKHTNHF